MYKLSPLVLLLYVCALFPSQRTISQVVPVLLNPATQPKFVNPLPIPSVLDVRAGGTHTITVSQTQQNLGLVDPVTLLPLSTTVWGYNGTYPGPTILAQSGVPANFVFLNNLPITPQGHLLPVDVSIDWAFSGDPAWQSKGVPIVTHLHGGQTESASDGLPLQWYTPGFTFKGPGFVKGTPLDPYVYSNNQEAATIWYHDHAFGVTRLNVYAGLAGFYIVTDANEAALQAANSIPSAPYDIGLAIQDRMFTANGQLYYPSAAPIAGAPEPSIQPEVFGDHILVNGMAWPVLDVEPRQYRFRMLDGSDSRFYDLFLSSGQSFFQIGSDDGLLESPFTTSRITIAPGERKDVVIDFSAFAGQTIILKNNARAPYPRGITVDPATTGQIMAFRVSKPLSSVPLTTLPVSLRPTINRLPAPVKTRQLILFEGMDQYGRLMTMLGTPQQGGMRFVDPVTERPVLNTVEVWEILNTTVDAHPIHVHMVKMQLLNRQKFSANVNITTGQITGPIQFKGAAKGPNVDERGWKDTYIMNPGEVTRITARFEIPGSSVWHCHILSHEEHDMMRPYEIVGPVAAAGAKVTTESTPAIENQLQFVVRPNPFNTKLQVEMNLSKESSVALNVYDVKGSKVMEVFNGKRQAGLQKFTLDGSQWSNGTYFVEVIVDNQRILRKLVLQK